MVRTRSGLVSRERKKSSPRARSPSKSRSSRSRSPSRSPLYGQRDKNVLYFWYPILQAPKYALQDRIFRSKKEAMTFSINVFKSINNENAATLAKKIAQLSETNPDDIYLQEGKFSLELRQVKLYK